MRSPAWSGLTAFSRAQRGGLWRHTSGDSAWRRNPCAIKWRLISNSERKKLKQCVLYCGKRIRLSSLLLHNCIDNSSVMYSTNAVARLWKGVALTNIIMNSRVISSKPITSSHIPADSVSFNMLVGYVIYACPIIYPKCLISRDCGSEMIPFYALGSCTMKGPTLNSPLVRRFYAMGSPGWPCQLRSIDTLPGLDIIEVF